MIKAWLVVLGLELAALLAAGWMLWKTLEWVE